MVNTANIKCCTDKMMSCMDKRWQKEWKSSQQSCEESWLDGSWKFDNHWCENWNTWQWEMTVSFRNSKFGTPKLFMASQKLLEWGEATPRHVLAFAERDEGVNNLVWGWMMEGELSFRTPGFGEYWKCVKWRSMWLSHRNYLSKYTLFIITISWLEISLIFTDK